MGKAICFLGSNQEKGILYRTSLKILNNLKENDFISDSVLYTAETLNLSFCKGCAKCFYTGNCDTDYIDNFNIVKSELLSSDLFIIGTPIYMNNVSSNIKLFFDRLAYWSYVMPLYQKKCIIIISSSSRDYQNTVKKYMENIISHFGCYILGTVMISNYTSEKEINWQIEKIIMNININNNKNYINFDFVNKLYNMKKNYFKNLEKSNQRVWEIEYWKNR